MIIKNKTPFITEQFNSMIAAYSAECYPLIFSQVRNYADFSEKYPPTDKKKLMQWSNQLAENGNFSNCYVIATSGTTSEPLILGSKIFQSISEDSYPYQIRKILSNHVFSATDTVANLLTAGCLGYNYEGMCRILEAIGSTILPIGRPDIMINAQQLIKTLKHFNTNVLLGSPSGIIQIAQEAIKHELDLSITKIVFTGEAFHLTKRDFIQQLWPKARFYSLYGATELGFAAINTPLLPPQDHLIISEWFFIEQTIAGELLITDLKAPLVPIIRYRIGDIGEIIQAVDGNHYLRIAERAAEEFSLGGHRISLELIKQKLTDSGLPSDSFQVKLSTTNAGKDRVTIIADIEQEREITGWKNTLTNNILKIPRINEAVSRGVAEIELSDNKGFSYNPRGKLCKLLDKRNDR